MKTKTIGTGDSAITLPIYFDANGEYYEIRVATSLSGYEAADYLRRLAQMLESGHAMADANTKITNRAAPEQSEPVASLAAGG